MPKMIKAVDKAVRKATMLMPAEDAATVLLGSELNILLLVAAGAELVVDDMLIY